MQKLDPKVVWLFFLKSLIRWVFVSVFLTIFLNFFLDIFNTLQLQTNLEEIDLNLILLIIPSIFVFILAWIWAKLTYHFYRYDLREDGFRMEMGVITKKYVTIPYERIQNVDIHRGILARILGLSDLQIQTAGMSASFSRYGVVGAGAEGRLPGLAKDVAEKVRDELIQKARRKA
ncbi:MAG: PH domain-containing protein [bacterium]|nr:PH domain-containing protein [bacterium]